MRFGCRMSDFGSSQRAIADLRLAVATVSAQQKPADPNDPRIGLEARTCAMPASRRAAWSWSRRGRAPKASTIRRTRPAWRCPASVRPTPRRRRRRHPRHLRPAAARRHRHRPAALRAELGRAAGRRRARLRQFRHRLQRHAHGDRQLPRLQRLRHREREEPARCWRRWSAPAARATSRSTATCCSCRSNRRAAASTAACRACTKPVSKERFRGVRIFDITDITQPEAGRGGADLPRLAHPHAGAEGQADAVCLRLGHRRRPLGRGAGRLLGRRSEGERRTRRSSAST